MGLDLGIAGQLLSLLYSLICFSPHCVLLLVTVRDVLVGVTKVARLLKNIYKVPTCNEILKHIMQNNRVY